MNERVVFKVELYKQALKFAYETAGVDTENGTILASLTAGRFAELIVKECMLCCERVISDPVRPESVDTWLNGGLSCIDEIKEHFGVEE